MRQAGRIIAALFFAAVCFGFGAILGLGVRTDEKLTGYQVSAACTHDRCAKPGYEASLKMVSCEYGGLRGTKYVTYLVEGWRGDVDVPDDQVKGGFPGPLPRMRELSAAQRAKAKAGDIEGICPRFYPPADEDGWLSARSVP